MSASEPSRRKQTSEKCLGAVTSQPGWARTQLSSDFVPFLRQQFDLGLSKEDAVEMYYNVVVTPWLNMTADLQVIDSAFNKTVLNGRLVNVDTAVVGALRMYLRF